MPEFDRPVVLQLQHGELLRWSETRDVWLSVVRGRVWITRAGDPADHFLEGGQSIRLAAGAQALVGAEGPVQIAVAQGPSRLERWRARWAAFWPRPGAPQTAQ